MAEDEGRWLYEERSRGLSHKKQNRETEGKLSVSRFCFFWSMLNYSSLAVEQFEGGAGVVVNAQTDGLVVVEGVKGTLDERGQGDVGEGLEVEEATVTPPGGIAVLAFEATCEVGMDGRVDVGLEECPLLLHLGYLVDAMLIVAAEGLPERLLVGGGGGGEASLGDVLQTVGDGLLPAYVMEPEEDLGGTGGGVVEKGGVAGGVLVGGVGASVTAAVEAKAEGVGTVVVGGHPVGTGTGLVAIGLGTVVMAPGKEVVEAEGHHVVDDGFTAAQKHGGEGAGCLRGGEGSGGGAGRVTGEEEGCPVAGNAVGLEVGLLAETAEGVPVGFGEVVAAEGEEGRLNV